MKKKESERVREGGEEEGTRRREGESRRRREKTYERERGRRKRRMRAMRRIKSKLTNRGTYFSIKRNTQIREEEC